MTTADIVLVGGQSNAVNITTASQPFPGGWTINPNVLIWNSKTVTWEIYRPGVNSYAAGPNWGPEAQYALDRYNATNNPVYLMKIAYPGTPLFPDGGSCWSPLSLGKTLWAYFIEFATICQEPLRASGLEPHINRLLWLQGETDASGLGLPAGTPYWGAAYRYFLSQFLDSLRIGLNAPDMKAIIYRIFSEYDPQNRLRNAQVDLGSRPENTWVDIDGADKTADQYPHLSVLGTQQAGHLAWLADQTKWP